MQTIILARASRIRFIYAHHVLMGLIFGSAVMTQSAVQAQEGSFPPPAKIRTPVAGTAGLAALSPGALQLLTLDGEFNQSVSKGGGAAFVEWFTDDAVTLSNGQQPVLTKAGIAVNAHWKPGEYQLQWQPMGAQMGDSGDMGFTWGHYDATTFHPGGNPTTQSGRYITIWKKQSTGGWKVALDASANEPKSAAPKSAETKP